MQTSEITDPYKWIISQTVERVKETLSELGYEVDLNTLLELVEEPSVEAYGDFSLPLFKIAKKYKVNPIKLASNIVENLSSKMPAYLIDVKNVSGYVNFYINYPEATKLLFNVVRNLGEKYGYVPVDKPKRIVIEHTSANPVHPLHIGHGRNSVIGDTLARLLRKRGHIVQTRFYVNDLGRQVAVLLYGYINAGRPKPPENIKPDKWLGQLYAVTNTLIEIYELKREAEKTKEADEERYRELVARLDTLLAVASELRSVNPELFDILAENLKSKDNEAEIQELMKKLEYREDPKLEEDLRRVVELCLKGIRETLRVLDIDFDKWDYESDLTWSSHVKKILEIAFNSPYFTYYKNAPAIDLTKLANKDLYRKLGIRLSMEIPPLILQRSDGTTLYTTRDLAYTLVKFNDFKADMVINVIGAEQKLPQAQLKLALYALGFKREAVNLVHYSYEMVNIPGMKMSSRLGRMITLDEIIELMLEKARREVEKRTTLTTPEEREEVVKAIAIGAIRYTLISTSATKPVVFDMDQALSFETNAAPYIQYTHARANNILRKHREKYGEINWETIDYKAVEENRKRKQLVKLALKYPSTIAKAADDLKPEILVEYVNKLADTFNSWYQEDPVIHEPNPGKRNLKAAITYTIKIILANTLETLGIKAPPRM